MIDFSAPLKVGPAGFGSHYNNTLHGRSIHRCEDVAGHNVFKGWRTWLDTGKCVGDALDSYCPPYTPVYAMHDGTQTVWRNDTEKAEVIYIQQGPVTTVYAHINARYEGVGIPIERGQQVGVVRWDLRNPHLHLEVWENPRHAIAALRPAELAAKLMELCDPAPVPVEWRLTFEGLPGEFLLSVVDGRTYLGVRDLQKVANWDIRIQGKHIHVIPPSS